MDVSGLRNYGVAWSDAEGAWPPSLERRMRRKGREVVFRRLSFRQRIRFLLAFLAAKRRAARLDLSALRDRGMTNDRFLARQLEYIALFAALARVLGTGRAVAILDEVMDETAREALLLCLPEPDAVRRLGQPFAVLREFFRAGTSACARGGCLQADFVETAEGEFGVDVRWCVWLELARLMGVPEACLPNCYSDQLVFPEYFGALGIEYRRTETLAQGGRRCDFRFVRTVVLATMVGSGAGAQEPEVRQRIEALAVAGDATPATEQALEDLVALGEGALGPIESAIEGRDDPTLRTLLLSAAARSHQEAWQGRVAREFEAAGPERRARLERVRRATPREQDEHLRALAAAGPVPLADLLVLWREGGTFVIGGELLESSSERARKLLVEGYPPETVLALSVHALYLPDAGSRIGAVQIVAGLDSLDALPHLLRRRDDPDPRVRQAFAQAVTTLSYRHPTWTDRLVSELLPLLRDPVPMVRSDTLYHLADAGRPEALPEISRLLASGEGWDEGLTYAIHCGTAAASLGSELLALYRRIRPGDDRASTTRILATIHAVEAVSLLEELERELAAEPRHELDPPGNGPADAAGGPDDPDRPVRWELRRTIQKLREARRGK